MMNNKGQSLVLAVILIPIIFLMLLFVYDICRMSLLKNELDNINYMAMEYGLDKLDEDNVVDIVNDLIDKNNDDLDKVDVHFEDDKLYIDIEEKMDTRIGNMKIFKVESSYVGYMDEDKKIIERNK